MSRELPTYLETTKRTYELPIEFKRYAEKVLPGYKPEVLWYSILRARANGVI